MFCFFAYQRQYTVLSFYDVNVTEWELLKQYSRNSPLNTNFLNVYCYDNYCLQQATLT